MNIKNRFKMNEKGQAFSTFKLLIAAVVAVAILGILLSILGGISMPVGFTDQAQGLLRDVSGGDMTRMGPEVSFSGGSIYGPGAFQSAAGGNPVTFVCRRAFCDVDEGTGELIINNDGRARIIACCTDDACFLGVGASAQDLRDEGCQ